MLKTLAIAIIGFALAACEARLFDEPPPITATDYVADVCESAGTDSQSCRDAGQLLALRCFRTIGTVDCYLSENPFATSTSGRFFVTPIDRRQPTPSPG